jgi:hypothetical protein
MMLNNARKFGLQHRRRGVPRLFFCCGATVIGRHEAVSLHGQTGIASYLIMTSCSRTLIMNEVMRLVL